MAKNKGFTATPDYARQQENMRKAKGNPNKNSHHKRKNSNYGGVDHQAQKASARMEAQNRRKESIFDMTPTGRIAFFVLLAIMLVLMILGMNTYKGNALVSFLSSLFTGATCGLLAYTAFSNKKKGKTASTFQTVLVWVLAGLGVLYGGTGIIGLVSLLRS